MGMLVVPGADDWMSLGILAVPGPDEWMLSFGVGDGT